MSWANYGIILSKVARGAFLLMLALMLLSWALTTGNSRPSQEQQQPPVPTDRMYS